MKLSWRAPRPELRPFVRGFVEREDTGAVGPSAELPLPMPLLHVKLGADYRLEMSDGVAPIPPASLWGSSTRVRRAMPQGRIHAFVAVLTFRGAALLARDPLLADEVRGLPDDGLFDAMTGATDFEARVAHAEERLLRTAGAEAPLSDVARAAQEIADDRFAGTVSALAQWLGTSERTLRHRFDREIGCLPKRLLRVARLGRAVRALHPRPWGARPAYDPRIEFFDEPHFAHEFRALAGLSPGSFVRGKRRCGDGLVHSFIIDEADRHGRAAP